MHYKSSDGKIKLEYRENNKKWDLKDEAKSWARTDAAEVQCPNEIGPNWLYLGDPSDKRPNDHAGDGIKVECGKLSIDPGGAQM